MKQHKCKHNMDWGVQRTKGYNYINSVNLWVQLLLCCLPTEEEIKCKIRNFFFFLTVIKIIFLDSFEESFEKTKFRVLNKYNHSCQVLRKNPQRSDNTDTNNTKY